jgi:hypothetical protein
MNDRKCKKCLITKPLTEFSFRKDRNNYHYQCKECFKIYNLNYQKEYYAINRNKIIKSKIIYAREKYSKCPKFRLKELIRNRIHGALQDLKNNEITMKYLGCSISQFYDWIEFQFYDGMDWNTKFHIDHTLPISSFDFESEEEIKKCFNWVNLRPLLPHKNLTKSNKINIKDYLFQEIKATYFLKNYNKI